MQPHNPFVNLPPFLVSSEAFSQHLQDQLGDQDNTEKGDSFLAFACKVLPFLDSFKEFGAPVASATKTHDGGVDFHAKHQHANERLAGQSKLRIREVAELDSIISKFHDYETSLSRQTTSKQGSLFPQNDVPRIVFVIVTSSDVGTIRQRYERSSLPSTEYYRSLSREDRLHIIDGPYLLKVMQALYRKSYLIEPEIEVNLAADSLKIGNVYMSAVSAKTLRGLYERYGSSLFFENIRDFLGISSNGDSSDLNVNEAIVDTLKKKPAMMLGRNNGITFRADKVDELDARRLVLRKGSIVNGCQTTMCTVSVGEDGDSALVAVKIVVDDDSWEVANQQIIRIV